MSEVKRYFHGIEWHGDNHASSVMEECKCGDYVLASDYDSLRRQLTESERLCAQRNVIVGTQGQRITVLENAIRSAATFIESLDPDDPEVDPADFEKGCREFAQELRSALTKQSEG